MIFILLFLLILIGVTGGVCFIYYKNSKNEDKIEIKKSENMTTSVKGGKSSEAKKSQQQGGNGGKPNVKPKKRKSKKNTIIESSEGGNTGENPSGKTNTDGNKPDNKPKIKKPKQKGKKDSNLSNPVKQQSLEYDIGKNSQRDQDLQNLNPEQTNNSDQLYDQNYYKAGSQGYNPADTSKQQNIPQSKQTNYQYYRQPTNQQYPNYQVNQSKVNKTQSRREPYKPSGTQELPKYDQANNQFPNPLLKVNKTQSRREPYKPSGTQELPKYEQANTQFPNPLFYDPSNLQSPSVVRDTGGQTTYPGQGAQNLRRPSIHDSRNPNHPLGMPKTSMYNITQSDMHKAPKQYPTHDPRMQPIYRSTYKAPGYTPQQHNNARKPMISPYKTKPELTATNERFKGMRNLAEQPKQSSATKNEPPKNKLNILNIDPDTLRRPPLRGYKKKSQE